MPPRAALASLLFAGALVHARPVAAQEPPADYSAIIEDAVSEFSEGHWAEARAHFERAHALYPNARTLRGIGMCAFELRDYPAAVRFLDQSLGATRRPLTDEQRADTQELIARARSYVGHFLVTTTPPGAEILVDDEVPSRGVDGRLMLALGEHVLVARAPGHREVRRRLDVGGGEDRELELRLPPSGLGDPPLLTIAGFVAGGAVLLVEPFSVGWWIDRESAISSCANPPAGTRCDNAAVLNDQRDAAIVTSVVAGVVALGVAAIGLVLWIVDSEGAAGSASLACGPQAGGVGCRF
ncbi:MAG: hypothetical protein H6719_03490 [Sandaracinaceae bacterium]|nr:hypothetical protein [Sandaracinaceae bacterium]